MIYFKKVGVQPSKTNYFPNDPSMRHSNWNWHKFGVKKSNLVEPNLFKIKIKEAIGYTFKKDDILSVIEERKEAYIVEAIHKLGRLAGKKYAVYIEKTKADKC